MYSRMVLPSYCRADPSCRINPRTHYTRRHLEWECEQQSTGRACDDCGRAEQTRKWKVEEEWRRRRKKRKKKSWTERDCSEHRHCCCRRVRRHAVVNCRCHASPALSAAVHPSYSHCDSLVRIV